MSPRVILLVVLLQRGRGLVLATANPAAEQLVRPSVGLLPLVRLDDVLPHLQLAIAHEVAERAVETRRGEVIVVLVVVRLRGVGCGVPTIRADFWVLVHFLVEVFNDFKLELDFRLKVFVKRLLKNFRVSR